MDKYRVKQYRSWNETGKQLRQLTGDKHHFIDNEERTQLQRCLDLLQKCIKVNSAQVSGSNFVLHLIAPVIPRCGKVAKLRAVTVKNVRIT